METKKQSSVRMRMLGTVVAVAALLPFAGHAGDSYPSKTVNLIVPFSPGGGTDIAARLLAIELTQKFGQSVVVENRPGASGQIAADYVARANPDGYTLLFANSGMLAINPWLFKLQSDPATAFAPVSMFCDLPFVMVAAPTLAANTVAEFIALAKAAPGKHTFASSGTGGAPHLSGEIFQSATDTQLMHVPYKGGGAAMTDLMAGRVDIMTASVLETTTYVNAGKLKALAVTGAVRSPAMPNVPTIDEAGVKNSQSGSWTAVLAPAGTPQAVVDKLAASIREVAANEDVKNKLIAQGAVAHSSTPDELAKLAASERARYGDIIKTRNLRLE